LDTPLGAALPRRDVLAGASAAALGITSLALPTGAAATSIPVATTLVAATGGVVYGWGTEWADGVFGTQSGDKTSPVEVTGTSFTWPEIVQVVTSRYNSFALAKNGDVYASGSNTTNNGRKIGDPNVSAATDVRTPVKAAISDVAQIAGGYKWVLVVKTSGQVWAWGGADAASGLASLTAAPTDVTTTLGLTALLTGGDTIVQVSSNYLHSIGLSASGRVFTWGSQTSSGSPGTLGQNTTGDLTSSTAAEIGVQSGGALVGKAGTEARIIQVSAGPFHSLALGRDGSVYAWGYNASNSSGSLGTGNLTNAGTPVNISANGDLAGTVGTSARIVQVSAGDDWSLAVGLDGAVYAWGNAGSGRLGNGTTSPNVTSPQRITGIEGSGLPTLAQTGSRIVQVSARQENGYALGADARVYGWGAGGRVGDGTSSQRTLPVEITASGAFANLSPNPGASRAPRRIVALATGDHFDAPHMLAIDDRG
jgi:alpha-tubulin suppressor-like RCC1 family protein